ncbi:MAG: zinc finger domain-containing protein [Candidatus Micrarchaeia archaeon]
MPGKTCISCGRLTKDYVEFKCPNCGKANIVRCSHCRETYVRYKCPECGFEGP